MYEKYGADITTEYDLVAAHTQPTDDPTLLSCTLAMTPYISNCNYDGAFNALNVISSKAPLNPKVQKNKKSLYKYSQTAVSSMGATGYAYVPDACTTTTDCDVHIAFHGCAQTIADISLKFVDLTGYQEVAEANNIIVMFPQASKSYYAPSNPNGCWDWWGYSDSFLTTGNYVTQDGVQMKQIFGHLTAL